MTVTKYSSIVDSGGIFRAVQRMANAIGLTLKEDPKCTQPVTNLKTKVVTVPSLSAYSSERHVNLWKGYVYHEVGHHAPAVSDTLPAMESGRIVPGTLFGMLCNIIDDIRNEHNGHGDYPGRDEALAITQGYHAKDGAQKVAEHGIDSMKTDMRLFAEVLALAYCYRADTFQPLVGSGALQYENVVPCDHFKFLYSDLDSMETIDDVINIVRKILDESDEHDTEEEEAKGKGEGGDSDGESENQEGNPDSEGEGEKSEDQSSESEDRPGKVSYKDLMGHDHRAFTSNKSKYKISIKYNHEPVYDWVPHPVHKILYPGGNGGYVSGGYQKAYDQGSKIGHEVRRLLQSKSQTLVTHNNKAGKIDRRDLYKVPNGSVDIFKKNINQIDMKSTAVFLLVDGSGSMSGTKFESAAAASALMTEALQVVQMPTMVAAFTEEYEFLKTWVMKQWGDHIPSTKLLKRFNEVEEDLYQNADGDSVMWAYTELMKRKERRKILIVLSDGQPACDRAGDASTHLKEVVKSISKKIEVYGIGIMSAAVEDYYPECAVLRHPNKLQETLLSVIKSKILN